MGRHAGIGAPGDNKNRLTSRPFLAHSSFPGLPPPFLNLLPMLLPPNRSTSELPTNIVAFPVDHLAASRPRLPLLPVSPSFAETGRVLPPPSMQAQLLEEAAKLVSDPQKLINIVSKRVRQLSQGHRPLVDPGPRVVYSDIALRELISGKLSYTDSDGSAAGGAPAEPAPESEKKGRGGSHR